MIEVKDIAEYEENDSELAKYTISKLSSEKKDLQQRIDKAIEELKTANVDIDSVRLCEIIEYAIHILEEGSEE